MAKQQPAKDPQTVTPDGKRLETPIQGLTIHPRPPLMDRRGELVEIYNPAWGISPDPLVYLYQVVLRPGAIRGWVIHRLQEDRLFVSSGVVRWVFYDDRIDSPTYRALRQYVFSDRNRALIILPRGVYHAVQNIGETEAVFINAPTRPYVHEDPDKYRLPLKNDLIPFDFEDGPGW